MALGGVTTSIEAPESTIVNALELGADIKTTQRLRTSLAGLTQGGEGHQLIMGHADIKTTQRYARLSDDAVRADAARVHAASAEFAEALVTKVVANGSLGA